MEDDSIDMVDGLKMTVSIWHMTVSIWDILSLWRQRLNPKRDETLSNIASTFYMGRYNKGCNATLWNGLGTQ